MQRLAYFKVCEAHEPQLFDLRHLLATRYPPSSTIYPMAASENCARWARGWIMVLVELKFSTLGVFKFDHGPRRCGPNMPFDRRCACFPLRWRVVASHQASEGVGGASPAAWWVVHHPVPTCTAWVVDHQYKPHHHHKYCKAPPNNAAPKAALSHTTPECIEPRFD